MLVSLSIKNFALIEDLQVSFTDGFTIITGETGAGKSILLGALSLVLGKRADLSTLKSADKKCIIEAEFSLDRYALEPLFKDLDIEYDSHTIIRREILPSGKSRAFINDSPVTLSVLSTLGALLIDIHSQHQTLSLTENSFQFEVIDAIAGATKLVSNYAALYSVYQKTKKSLSELYAIKKQALQEQDYNAFLLEELENAQLSPGMQQELEAIYEQLSNVESIQEHLSGVSAALSDEQMGVFTILSSAKAMLSKIAGYGKHYQDLQDRLQGVYIELDDIYSDIEHRQMALEADPALLSKTNDSLQLLYDLQKKHHVSGLEELLEVQHNLQLKVSQTQDLDTEITALEETLFLTTKQLDALALKISKKREKAIPVFNKKIQVLLTDLGMPNARFNITLSPLLDYKANGKDVLSFLFCANKGGVYGELKKVASGGELSRIMLSVKAILAQYKHLPTIMFDEIDTGVSGEISNKMAEIMAHMSKHMQVYAITHLPQVAAKGDMHYKVFKSDKKGKTTTELQQLDTNQRIAEIAKMLSGDRVTDAALAHAKDLMD